MSLESELRDIVKALENQVSFAYAQNRELVFEIGARDQVISALQTQLAKLEDENQNLRLYHKDWCEGRSANDYSRPRR